MLKTNKKIVFWFIFSLISTTFKQRLLNPVLLSFSGTLSVVLVTEKQQRKSCQTDIFNMMSPTQHKADYRYFDIWTSPCLHLPFKFSHSVQAHKGSWKAPGGQECARRTSKPQLSWNESWPSVQTHIYSDGIFFHILFLQSLNR